MQIREITADEVNQLQKLFYNAFPGYYKQEILSKEDRARLEPGPYRTRYGAFDGSTMVGSYVLLHRHTNIGGRYIPCGGIGGVVVALDQKKKRVARDMIEHSLGVMHEKQMPISMLYPFRSDFYQSLGWGHAVAAREFQFRPTSLPVFPERNQVKALVPEDVPALKQCYEEYALTRNGMMMRHELNWSGQLENASRIFCFHGPAGFEGYISLGFQAEPETQHPLANQIFVRELIYRSFAAYFGLLGFLASQNDQVTRIVWCSPMDERLDLLLKDPTNSRHEAMWDHYELAGRVGVGAMLRIVDLREALLQRGSYNGVTLELGIKITDVLVERNSHPLTLCLTDGKPSLIEGGEIMLTTNISTFSQLFAGYITLQEAIFARQAECCYPELIPKIQRAFSAERANFCLTFF